MTANAHEWPGSLRWQRRRIVALLIVGLILALGPVWGLLYTLWGVLMAVVEAGRDVSLHEVKRVSLSLRPTLTGLAFAPPGIALCAWSITLLAALRKKALHIEHSRI